MYKYFIAQLISPKQCNRILHQDCRFVTQQVNSRLEIFVPLTCILFCFRQVALSHRTHFISHVWEILLRSSGITKLITFYHSLSVSNTCTLHVYAIVCTCIWYGLYKILQDLIILPNCRFCYFLLHNVAFLRVVVNCFHNCRCNGQGGRNHDADVAYNARQLTWQLR